MTILIGILSFSLVSLGLSWTVGRRARTVDSGETSVFVLLVSWAAMFFGMYLMRFA